MNVFYLSKALNALRPNCAFGCSDTYDSIEWYSNNTESLPTEDEVNAKVTELKNAEPMRLLRIERDKRIATSDWRIVMAKETGSNIPAAWKTYRQALRDLPSTQTPVLDSNNPVGISSVTWPTEPT
tara:strand:- start:385 stop:762 length:378 start_codon:yes stop_codon:yes gene_type:complete